MHSILSPLVISCIITSNNNIGPNDNELKDNVNGTIIEVVKKGTL